MKQKKDLQKNSTLGDECVVEQFVAHLTRMIAKQHAKAVAKGHQGIISKNKLGSRKS